MTALRHFDSTSRSKHVVFSPLVALSSFPMRHIWPYICGIISFAQMSSVLLFDEARHQAGKLQQIGHPEHRPTFTEDDLGIGGDDVGPLPRHREDVILVDA